MATRRLKVEILGDASSLDRAFAKAERSSKRFGQSMGRSTGGKFGGMFGAAGLGAVGKAGVIGAGVAAGTAVTVRVLSSVIDKAKEAQVAQANLAQAFAASGTSTARYGKQVDKAIQSTSRLAAIDDELVSDSYASLLRTTGSVAKATRGVALAANIARAKKISLAAATKIVEKAENGQLRSLRLVGVQIDKNTTSQEAIERAQKKFAGSAAAYGKTAAGAQEKLNVALENVQERIGAKLLPVVTKLALKLVDFLDWSERNWPQFARSVQETYQKVKPVIDSMVARIKGVANVIAGVAQIVHGIATGDWAEAWRGFKQFAVDGVAGIAKAVATLPLKIAASLGKSVFSALERAFVGALNRIIAVIRKALSAYNAIPLVPNVGLPGFIGGAAPSASKVPSPRPDEGTRGLSSTTTVNLVVDGRVLAQTVIPEINKRSKQNAPQARGRAARNAI